MSNRTHRFQSDPDQYTLSLNDEGATQRTLTGGKGANLARLVAADFPVPDGFCVTTAVYHEFIISSEVQTTIESLELLEPDDSERITEMSAEIRSEIRQRDLPETVQTAIVNALKGLDASAYAVRSSATAEDLPTASFAGQHESFLAITEPETVLDRIRDCIASLFTDRAVAYRLQNDVSHDAVAMAIVVQEMVDPEIAGVLFTADPVSGNRHIASIDANYGLGDTVVAGEVSPDNVRVDQRTGDVLEYEIGEKSHALYTNREEEGTKAVDISSEDQESRTLSDTKLRELVELGTQVDKLLGGPQDIEWAFVDGDVILLQSRPITSLFPLPSPSPSPPPSLSPSRSSDDDRRHIYFCMGHQQAMPEAIPPLSVGLLQEMVNSSASRLRQTDEPIAVEAGHRIYVDLTPLLHNRLTRRVVLRILTSMSEPAARTIAELIEERQTPPPAGVADRLQTISRVVHTLPVAVSAAPRLVARFVRPFIRGPQDSERVYEVVESNGQQIAERVSQPRSQADQVRVIYEEIGLGTLATKIVSQSMPLFLAGAIAGSILERLYPNAEDDLDALGKGFDDEIATQINQRLGDLADLARQHPAVVDALESKAPLSEIEQVEGGENFVTAFDAFLDDFGHRSSSEIDFSRPRWKDNPAILFQTIRSTLAQSDHGEHREHLERLKQNAAQSAAALEARAGRGLVGFIKKPIVRRLIRVYRGGIQLREYHKHGAAHFFAIAHDVFADAGETLAAEGRIDQSSDVWYLRKDELLAALEGETPLDVDFEQRQRTHDRFASMTAPPLLMSDGETPMVAADTKIAADALVGTPVSSGVVEGPARVVYDPSKESLEKGEILVAPSTDVGWTPLFQNAAGLVMDVGGQMTHGALVAREYGIPAVVSVSNATTDIQTGEWIRVDGKRGTVERLDREEQSPANEDLGDRE
ncbi:PEP/pyruvate-binding domain-containing protein [Halocatena marina]|uniref:PEP/pyruvate-binding domain-containing protein n=1 Tax=Halocatena marina TaxID=2934937 RepID=UPI0022252D30|nr:PEP/pyruvate-binding domain-containing protein [Halocatena marina]